MKTAHLKLSQKGLILVSVPLLFELIFVLTLATLLQQAEAETVREVQARSIMGNVEQINIALMDAGEAATGYGMSKSGVFLDEFDDVIKNVPNEFKALVSLTNNSKSQLAAVKRSQALVEKLIANLSNGLQLIENGEQLKGLGQLEQWKVLQREFRSQADDILREQQEIVNRSPAARARSRAEIVNVLGAGLLFNIILAFALAWYFHRGTTSRLNVLMDNTFRLSKQEPLLNVLEGDDEIGHLDGVFHTMAEVLAEAARKERAIIDNAQDVICAIDEQGTFTKISAASLKVWGYLPEELIGKNFSDLVVKQDVDKGLMNARENVGAVSIENRVRRKDGVIIHMLWSIYWSPTEQALFCVAHDITQRKRAEEELRASDARTRQIIDSMPVGLFIIDDDGFIQMNNPAAAEMLRFAPGELTGRHIMAMFNAPRQKDPYEFMDALFDDALGRITERDAQRKDGTIFAMEFSLKAYLAREGRRYLVIALDVSKRHEVDRLKQEFLAMVSHDLRSPLTSIQAFLTMLSHGRYGQLTPEGFESASLADGSAARLLALVNDLLDLDKLESGRFDMEFENIPITAVIHQSVDAIRAVAEQRGIVIEEPKAEERVHADQDRLVQVMVNLLGNAVKYSPPGEAVVISVQSTVDWVEVRVTDKGRGVPAHLREAIFERFKQVDARDRKEKGGSGLGLAISKALMEQHKGLIGVDSEDGKGSSFWFKVPPAHSAE